MKRIIALLLAVCLLLALGACGKKETKKDPIQDSAEAASQAAAAAQNAAPDQSAQADGQAAQSGDNTENGDAADQTPTQPAESTVDFAEIHNTVGARLAAPTVVAPENETLQVLEENGAQIAQYTFLVGSIPCGIRFSPDFNADISGVTNDAGATPFSGTDEEVVNIPGAILGRWVTVDGQYVLIVADENPEYFNELFEDYKTITTE